MITSISTINSRVIQSKKSQGEGAVEICNCLWGKRAAVTASIDSLFWPDENAPGGFWTDQEGSPFQNLLKFKKRHPQFKITITFSPKPHLINVRNAPERVKQWILSVQKDFDWIEIANHGLTHEEEKSLEGHEFDPYYNLDALNFMWCRERVKEIREIFKEIGLDNSEITGFRGPGFRWTDPLIDALVEHDFLYVLVRGAFRWRSPLRLLFQSIVRNVGRGRTFVETFRIHPFYYVTNKNNKILFIPTNVHPTYQDFESIYSYIILKHGVINFFYHFDDKIYEEFDKRLTFLERFDSNPSDGLNGDELWWCTTGELAKYWIKRENTRIKDISKQKKAWKLEIQSNSSPRFPTSILLRVNPNDISRIIRDGQELTWTITKEGAVVTTILPEGTSTILVEFKREPRKIESYEEVEQKIAQEIYQSWVRRATLSRISNGFSLMTLFLIKLGFLFVTESIGLKLLEPIKYALIFIAAIGLSFWAALKSGFLITRLTTTGYRPVRKYLLYLKNVALNPFKTYSLFNKHILIALCMFIFLWLSLFLI